MSFEEVLAPSPIPFADETPAEVAAGGISSVVAATPVASSLALDLTVLSAEGTTAGELTPAVVTVGFWRPPVAVVKAPIRRKASSSPLDFTDSPAASTSDDEPAIEVIAGRMLVSSDDEFD